MNINIIVIFKHFTFIFLISFHQPDLIYYLYHIVMNIDSMVTYCNITVVFLFIYLNNQMEKQR